MSPIATHQTTVRFANGRRVEHTQHTSLASVHRYLDRVVDIQDRGIFPADLTARIEELPGPCVTCSGTGTVYVQGGTWDERIADICLDCEGA